MMSEPKLSGKLTETSANVANKLQKLIINGHLHSPYFIFIRCAQELGDADILQQFGVSAYVRTSFAPLTSIYTILADDGTWMMLADNWLYSLWHNPLTRLTIKLLAPKYDIFACSVGDCDDSFDFLYYQNGQLVRKYVVTDPYFQGGFVVEDIGDSLSGESHLMVNQQNPQRFLLQLAASLGIKTNYEENDLRIYMRPTSI